MKQLSKKQIEDLKAKHGEVFEITYGDGDYLYLRQPTNEEVSLAFNASRELLEGSAKVLLENCLVAGDESVKTDTRVAISITPHADNICAVKHSAIKKL